METSVRIRFGYLTLVVGSLLGILGLLLRGPVPLPNMDIESWSSGVTSSNYFLAQVLTIFAYVIPYVGFWAIYASIAMIEKVERAAFWGFMSSIVGTSLAIATLGVFSFVSPRLAELYLQGNEQLPNIIIEVATGQPAIINILGGTLFVGYRAVGNRYLEKWIAPKMGRSADRFTLHLPDFWIHVFPSALTELGFSLFRRDVVVL